MYPGTSHTIDDDIRLQLLTHPFFESETRSFELQQHMFDATSPRNGFDRAVLELLNRERFDYDDKIIEYWFQNNPRLDAHCDYNFIYRQRMMLNSPDWPHHVDESLITSPITVAVYLQVEDLVGGELCISHTPWREVPEAALAPNDIKDRPYDTLVPTQGLIYYFKGSHHYHWVNEIKSGIRRGMLINFWPRELLDVVL